MFKGFLSRTSKDSRAKEKNNAKHLDPGGTCKDERKPSLEIKARKGEVAFEEEAAITVLPFFEDLTKNNVRKLLTYCTRQTFNPGEIIVEQGRGENSFYVIVFGDVQLCTASEDGTSKVLSVKKTADFFGETALENTGSQIRFTPVTAIALTTAVLLVIPPEKYKQFLEDVPAAVPCVAPLRGDCSMRVRLSNLPFLKDIDDDKLYLLSVLFEFRRCKAGQLVCQQGDPAEGLYIVVKGRCVVSVTVDGEEGVNHVHLGTLGPDDWFGEIALVERVRRTADVTTSQDCLFLFISYKNFQKFLQIAPDVQKSDAFSSLIRKRTAGTLKSIPFFNVVMAKEVGPMRKYEEKSLELLGNLFRFVEVEKDSIIFKEGDESDAFYILLMGTARPHLAVNDKQVILRDYRQNDLIGEEAVLDGARRTTTVKAVTDCVLLQLKSEHAKELLEVAPSFKRQLQHLAASRTAECMKSLPFFASVKENKPWSKLGLFAAMFVFEYYPPGYLLVKQGEVGNKFYILVRGKVQVFTGEGDSKIVLKEMVDDDFFGEIALLKNSPRTASISCVESCLVLTLRSENFKSFISLAPELVDQLKLIVEARTATTLRNMPLFKGLSENKPWSKLDLLAGLFSYEKREPGEVVVQQGTVGDSFYAVCMGELSVTSENSQGVKTVHGTMTAGDYFGEIALLNDEPRTATVTATQPCVLISLKREQFNVFLKIAPEMEKLLKVSVEERKRAP